MALAIEKMADGDLLEQWRKEVDGLRAVETQNPQWEWKPIQLRLERLHALAHEIRAKKAQSRAKWQP